MNIINKTKIIVCLLLPLFFNAQIITKKVLIPKGKNSTTINGTIKGSQTIDYILNLTKNQKFTIDLATKNNSLYFNVLAPGAVDEAFYIGSNDGNSFSGTSNITGSYKIRVYLYRSTARKGTIANYTLKISTNTPTISSNQNHDALVNGTNYHATGEIKNGQGYSKFGVIRSNSGAELHIFSADKISKIFKFSQGEWTCEYGICKLTFAKISSDEWELICNGTDKYYIPDAVIYGG